MMNFFNGIDLQSPGHVNVCELLVQENIPFFYEAPISIPNDVARNRRMDLAIPGPHLILVVEIDGQQHNETKNRSDDYLRDRIISRFARTIRFTHAEAELRPQDVIQTIRLELEIDAKTTFSRHYDEGLEQRDHKILTLRKEVNDKERKIKELESRIVEIKERDEMAVLHSEIVRKFRAAAKTAESKYIELLQNTKDARELEPVIETLKQRISHAEMRSSWKDAEIRRLQDQLASAHSKCCDSSEEVNEVFDTRENSIVKRFISLIKR